MKLVGLDINLWGVLLAALMSMLIGGIYYANAVLGKTWKKLAKIDEKRYQKHLPRTLPLLFVGALITAYILGFIICLYQSFYIIPWLTASLATALILWLLVSITIAVHNALDQRPFELTVISIGNRLFTFLAMALVYARFHP